jgi:predicted ATPase
MSAFLRSLKLNNFLSFGPESKAVELTPLNVIIGPNASGKSNFIEAIELLHSTPTDLAGPIRFGGTAGEWLWKGHPIPEPAVIEAKLRKTKALPELRYRLAFTETQFRMELVEELLARPVSSPDDLPYVYHYQQGRMATIRQFVSFEGPGKRPYLTKKLDLNSLKIDQSIFSQRKDPEQYPEIGWVAAEFGKIQTFREWTFGRTAALRQPQRADLPADVLHPNILNLGLVLNHLEHTDIWPRYRSYVNRFLPRFSHLSVKVQSGSVQIMMQEEGFASPISATRLSDGTLRFLALLALLLKPEPSPLICIEEPELGLHPDGLAIIAELLVEASQRTQIVVTTHSDVLESALTEYADSVLVCEHLGGRGTQLQRLESEKLQEWLKEYRLGQIWRIGKLGGNLW